ncbi:hypothetical protein J8273_8218 [Carpediemonas membranifera]|uniref:Uncharacterized protein n=1 Tax=Carpediemonas membranifera TaxID=201153 RepID=A0A8J6APX4_9EUKA|nr:hypothetical protein J8273_8218 [Carpediemonas membranifera]|eukprot:KAG9390178.1 hypothetical protein J8273_8218 [Carpediemonas membranifera]
MLALIAISALAFFIALGFTGLNDDAMRRAMWNCIPVLPDAVRSLQATLRSLRATKKQISKTNDSKMVTAEEPEPSQPEEDIQAETPSSDADDEPKEEEQEDLADVISPEVDTEVLDEEDTERQAEFNAQLLDTLLVAEQCAASLTAAARVRQQTAREAMPEATPALAQDELSAASRRAVELDDSGPAAMEQGLADTDYHPDFVRTYLSRVDRTQLSQVYESIAKIVAALPDSEKALRLAIAAFRATPRHTPPAALNGLFHALPVRKKADSPSVADYHDEVDAIDAALTIYEYLYPIKASLTLNQISALSGGRMPEADLDTMMAAIATHSNKTPQDTIRLIVSAAGGKTFFGHTLPHTLLALLLAYHDAEKSTAAVTLLRHLLSMGKDKLSFAVQAHARLPDLKSHDAGSAKTLVSALAVRLLLPTTTGPVVAWDPALGVLGAVSEVAPPHVLTQGDRVGTYWIQLASTLGEMKELDVKARISVVVGIEDSEDKIVISNVSLEDLGWVGRLSQIFPTFSVHSLAGIRSFPDIMQLLSAALQTDTAVDVTSLTEFVHEKFLPAYGDMIELYQVAFKSVLTLALWDGHPAAYRQEMLNLSAHSKDLDSLVLLFDARYGLVQNRVYRRISDSLLANGDQLPGAALLSVAKGVFQADAGLWCPDVIALASKLVCDELTR